MIEVIASLLALAYVIFAIYEKKVCWPLAALSAFLYIFVYFDAKLYLEACLQLFFIAIAIKAYLLWGTEDTLFKISRISLKKHILIIAAGCSLSFILGQLLIQFSDADLPYIDAAITVFSISTTFLTAKKILENWIYWIVIDLVAVFVYIHKELYPTAIIFFLYVILAIQGFRTWQKKFHS